MTWIVRGTADLKKSALPSLGLTQYIFPPSFLAMRAINYWMKNKNRPRARRLIFIPMIILYSSWALVDAICVAALLPFVLLAHAITAPWRYKYNKIINDTEMITHLGEKASLYTLNNRPWYGLRKKFDIQYHSIVWFANGKPALNFRVKENTSDEFHDFQIPLTQNNLAHIKQFIHASRSLNLFDINDDENDLKIFSITRAITFIENEIQQKKAFEAASNTHKFLLDSPLCDKKNLLALIYSMADLGTDKENKIAFHEFKSLANPAPLDMRQIKSEKSITLHEPKVHEDLKDIHIEVSEEKHANSDEDEEKSVKFYY